MEPHRRLLSKRQSSMREQARNIPSLDLLALFRRVVVKSEMKTCEFGPSRLTKEVTNVSEKLRVKACLNSVSLRLLMKTQIENLTLFGLSEKEHLLAHITKQSLNLTAEPDLRF